jgi:2-keto-4-pentenoate hydratase/2-oxohepta-3-ene-1,7-dioic acid hydratase in catechol pathway
VIPVICYGKLMNLFYVSVFTLKIGDIIFTGTPAGVAAVKPDDILEGF